MKIFLIIFGIVAVYFSAGLIVLTLKWKAYKILPIMVGCLLINLILLLVNLGVFK